MNNFYTPGEFMLQRAQTKDLKLTTYHFSFKPGSYMR